MIVWILTITMIHGRVEYGYKFLEKKNCEKVGIDITKKIKASYNCKRKKYELNTNI